MPPKERAASAAALKEEKAAQKAAADAEAHEASIWAIGGKDNSKLKAMEDKDEEKRRKAAEKAALLAAEEADMSGVKREVKTKKKGKDAFDLLDAALAKMPKTKAQKEAEEKKKLAEEQKAKEELKRAEKEARLKQEQDAIKQAAAKGIVLNHTDDLFVKINNRLEEDDVDVSGVDGALDALSMGGGKLDDHPERRQKVQIDHYHSSFTVCYPGAMCSYVPITYLSVTHYHHLSSHSSLLSHYVS